MNEETEHSSKVLLTANLPSNEHGLELSIEILHAIMLKGYKTSRGQIRFIKNRVFFRGHSMTM